MRRRAPRLEGAVMVGSSRRRRLAGAGALVIALGYLLTLIPSAGAARTDRLTLRPRARTQHACGAVIGRRARCAAIEVLDPETVAANLRAKGQPARRRPPATTTTSSSTTTSTSTTTTSTSIPTAGCTIAHAGYTPCDLRSAYALTSSGGVGQTVAIVDAYDDPNAAADLAVYRAAYGLPACTTANGCFRKIDQNGGTNYPVANTGWAEE